MKKTIFTICMAIFALMSGVSCAPESDKYEVKRYLCNFEGAYWDALVDSEQYMGPLLYSAIPYSWYDAASDLASDSTSSEYDGVYYWGNGTALSNYFSTDYASNGTFMEQLTICAEGAHSGRNAIVCTGYYTGWGDFRPSLYFKSKRSFIESVWVANTTYSRNVAENGYRMADDKLAEDKSIWIEAEGFVVDENGAEVSVAKTKFYLYKNGKPAFEGWTKWYLTSMPKVDIIKFNVLWDGEGDNPFPAYFALDDITVVRQELK